jgi:hypothetical protein
MALIFTFFLNILSLHALSTISLPHSKVINVTLWIEVCIPIAGRIHATYKTLNYAHHWTVSILSPLTQILLCLHFFLFFAPFSLTLSRSLSNVFIYVPFFFSVLENSASQSSPCICLPPSLLQTVIELQNHEKAER